MITTAIGYLAYIFGISALVTGVARKYPKKIFNYLPPIVIIFMTTILLYSVGAWEMTDEIKATKNFINSNFVPAMVFLMCLSCNLKKILKLGPKLIAIFLAGSVTVTIGFLIAFIIFGRGVENSSVIFASVNGSYVGASQNLLALWRSLNPEGSGMGNMLLMVNIPYAFWIMILVVAGTKSNADKFNAWTKADTTSIHEVSKNLDAAEGKKYFGTLDIMMVVAVSFVAVFVCRMLANVTPTIAYINSGVWEFIYVTILGLILAFTPLGKLNGTDEIAGFMVLVTMTVAGSYTNILELANAWQFVFAGFLAILVHGVLMVLLAKLFHWDLHSIESSSIANIGGPSSAPVVTGTFHKSYVSISVLMAAVGCIIGTFVGLGIYKVFTILW